MRKHGWQLPYHPLQVVAIAVFLALGFAFYVFFVPFVGQKLFQYAVMGLYTPLVLSVCCIYIWCAAADPGDPGVFKSKKCLNFVNGKNSVHGNESKQSRSVENLSQIGRDGPLENVSSKELQKNNITCCIVNAFFLMFSWCPCSLIWTNPCSREQTSEEQSTEDGMFYCNLCEVEVYKYSKHCRVCDKCVDGFDHHCRWLNNCIGRKNYRRFFVLMVSALLLLILQWSSGILVLVRCFVDRRHFNVDIATKLGSSFSLAPFIVVVVSCTLLAMVATLPLAQLFFFHVLLIQKGISTYDYIMALREQEQQGLGGLQSPQMSTLSSFTGLSSTSSFNTFHRAGWCTPPRLFVEDQCDVVPPESSSGKRMAIEEHNRKKLPGAVKISTWTLARLDAEDVSKAAAQARKKSKILQPVVRRECLVELETDNSFGNRNGRIASRIDHRRRGGTSKRGGSSRLPSNLSLERLAKISASATDSNESDIDPVRCTNLAPLQHEARTAFHTSRAMSCTEILASSSPESSLESPDQFEMASGTEAILASSVDDTSSQKEIRFSRSTSDGYEASGGEDSDRVPSRIVHRSSNWSNLAFNSGRNTTIDNILRASTSTGMNVSNLGRPF